MNSNVASCVLDVMVVCLDVYHLYIVTVAVNVFLLWSSSAPTSQNTSVNAALSTSSLSSILS